MEVTVKKVFSSHFDNFLSKVNKIYSLYEFYHQIFIVSYSLIFSISFLFFNFIFDIPKDINLSICFIFSTYFFYSVFFAPKWYFCLIKRKRLYYKYISYKNLFKKHKTQLILSALSNSNRKELLFYKAYINKQLKKMNKQERENIIYELNNEFINFKPTEI